ncbi:MAG: hypothetical protein R8N23_13520 [Reichenbachiella sp.]|uniref:hypothetical protein n=1 Tax=Reichenbachiella sp. TaxID=2184521 RepID=UPI002966D1C0|nr:hypothetical protein [Reichenbachiella sp.]MDW3210889.1 hypothetical protein [Reichenbachiella sp.]
MKLKQIPVFSLFLFLSALLLDSCAPSHPLVLDAAWENAVYEPRNFRKVAVFGMSKDIKTKKEFEKDAVKYFKSKGVPAVAGYTLFEHEPEGDEVNRSDIKKELFAQGFDGVLTASSIENISTDDDDITDEELARHAEGIYKFGQYFEARYDHLQSDVDHSHHKYSILEANFYYLMDYNEFDGNGLVWISHFKYDLEKKSDVAIEIDNYAHVIVNALFEDQVILERGN